MEKSTPISAHQVGHYVLHECEQRKYPVTAQKLSKLVYICHGYHLALTGKPLFYEPAEVWQYGPMVREIYYAVKQFAKKPIPAQTLSGFAATPITELGKESRKIISDVVESYGRYSGNDLSTATAKPGTPWAMMKRAGGEGEIIPDWLLKTYYSQLVEIMRKESAEENIGTVRAG